MAVPPVRPVRPATNAGLGGQVVMTTRPAEKVEDDMTQPTWHDLDEAVPAGPWAWYDSDTDEQVTSSTGPDGYGRRIALRTTWERPAEHLTGFSLPEFILSSVEQGFGTDEDDTAILAFIARARTEWPEAERRAELAETRATEGDLDAYELGYRKGKADAQERIVATLRSTFPRVTRIIAEIEGLDR